MNLDIADRQDQKDVTVNSLPEIGARNVNVHLDNGQIKLNPGESVHAVQYQEEEAMPELCKLLEVKPSTIVPCLVDICIPAASITTGNPHVKARQLWGTDTYTDDSDIVAVLMHSGWYIPGPQPPPAVVKEVRATLRIMEPQQRYPSCLRNNMRSRAWGAARGNCSYSVEACFLVKSDGQSLPIRAIPLTCGQPVPTLIPSATAMAPTASQFSAMAERTMTTRASLQNSARQNRFLQEVTVQFNLSNEPWLKYNLSTVADRGLKLSQLTSMRLKRTEVLYVETSFKRFELSFQCERTSTGLNQELDDGETKDSATDKNHGSDVNVISVDEQPQYSAQDHAGIKEQIFSESVDLYRWSLCKTNLSLSGFRKKGCPLPADSVSVVTEDLVWEEIQWASNTVTIRGIPYNLARAQFLPKSVPWDT